MWPAWPSRLAAICLSARVVSEPDNRRDVFADRFAAEGKTLAGGVVYASTTPALTGAQRSLSPDLRRQIHRLSSATRQPVAVGIGVSAPDQAAQVSAFADGVVVGSASICRRRTHPNAPSTAPARPPATFAAEGRHTRSSAA